MNKEYIIKHKNIPVISFILNIDSYEVEKINKIYDIERLPFGYRNGKETSYINQLNKWINHRGISESRRDYEDFLYRTNASSAKDLSVYSLGLNLTDHYWFHKVKKDLQWEKLNFFDNDFKELVLKRLFPSDNENDTSNIHPDFSVDGSLIKMWIHDKKDRILIKEGKSLNNQEPYNEVIASKIMTELNFEHVHYSLKSIKGKKASICKCMVDRNTEFITASFIFDIEMNKNKNPYKQYIEICEKHGIKNIKQKLDEMIFIDFIIGNTDRQKRNFGIIRNADTLEWIKVCPIFDNGNSLFFDVDIKGSTKDNIDSYCKWFKNSNYEKLKYIDYPHWYNKNKLDKLKDIVLKELNKNNKIKKEKISKIVKIIENRIKDFEKIIERKKCLKY